MEHIKLVG